mgnify:CR=1 FL=1
METKFKFNREELDRSLEALFDLLKKFYIVEANLADWSGINTRKLWNGEIKRSEDTIANSVNIVYTYSKSSIVLNAIAMEIEHSTKRIQRSYERLEEIETRYISDGKINENELVELSHEVYEEIFGYYNEFSLLRMIIGAAVIASEDKDSIYQSPDEFLFAVKENISKEPESVFANMERHN